MKRSERIATLTRMAIIIIENGLLQRSKNEIIRLDHDPKKELDMAVETLNVTNDQKYSQDEIDEALRNLRSKYFIKTDPGKSIVFDYDQENWYEKAIENNEFSDEFWLRYKNFLIDKKNFSPIVVNNLDKEILDQRLMNYILDPRVKYDSPRFNRGLVIGDVQSGKTSTYLGFMCKAADAGYKVFILLTGTIESLRKQTQERVEEGIIGIDMSDPNKGKRVGVGLDNKELLATGFTSRDADFTGEKDKITLCLKKSNAVIFVIKKQKDVLEKLKKWLVTLNADPATGKIDSPMILIDDEADNASINTNKVKEDPTTINRLIRELASVFTISNYVGFTATPYANVFIAPNNDDKMVQQDLFPENFIVSLPTPSNYIGSNRIFANDAEFKDQVNYIEDAGVEKEDNHSFYFKHKKDWRGELPQSLTDAIYTFYLANAIRDLKGQSETHRSMLVNITRFIDVQKYVKKEITEIHDKAYRAIKFNIDSNIDKCLKDPILKRIYDVWKEQFKSCAFSWEQISKILFKSIENIKIQVVNSSKNTEKLVYPKKSCIRVIAIGGLALSRGLTLEGLMVSYFYRNTCTYDVLMQMGRWFGYREGYEDLFRIWIHARSAEWYNKIAEATELLKSDFDKMRELKLKPKNFGIRVRNDAEELQITAKNKMRNASDEDEITNFFGAVYDTPYVYDDIKTNLNNYNVLTNFITSIVKDKDENGKSEDIQESQKVIRNVSKSRIISFLKDISFPKCNSRFDKSQIISSLTSNLSSKLDLFDVIFINGSDEETIIEPFCINKVHRTSEVLSEKNIIALSLNGALCGPSDGQKCLDDELINNAKKSFLSKKYKIDVAEKNIEEAEDYCRSQAACSNKSINYPNKVWFQFVENRHPALFIYLVNVCCQKNMKNQKEQIDKYNKDMKENPTVAIALGIPSDGNSNGGETVSYKVNSQYNYFDNDLDQDIGDEE